MPSAPPEWKEEITKPLREWLHEKRARCNWSVEIENVGHVGGYVINGHLVLILDFGDGGWDAFTPVKAQDIPGTLQEMAAACGIGGSA